MKITRAGLKQLIKEELEANMEEGMFGDMKDKLAGIGSKVLSTMEDIAMVPAQLGVGFILGIAFNEMPRKDFDVSEVTREMLVAFGNMASSEDWSPKEFAYDWKNMKKDELLAKYFDSGREGPFSRYNK